MPTIFVFNLRRSITNLYNLTNGSPVGKLMARAIARPGLTISEVPDSIRTSRDD